MQSPPLLLLLAQKQLLSQSQLILLRVKQSRGQPLILTLLVMLFKRLLDLDRLAHTQLPILLTRPLVLPFQLMQTSSPTPSVLLYRNLLVVDKLALTLLTLGNTFTSAMLASFASEGL